MKISIFNSILKEGEKNSLLYNSFTDRFLVIDNSMLTKISDANYIDQFEKENSEGFKKLLKSGWFIEDNVDEVELVKARQLLRDNNDNQFLLIINTTLDCNFRCWYCYETHLTKSRLSAQTKQALKKLITNKVVHEGINHFSMSFFGGEPLIDFDAINDLTAYTYNLCKKNDVKLSFGMTSNGYLLNKNRIEKLASYDLSPIQITLDGDRTTHNKVRFISKKKGSYDKIVNNVKELAKAGVGVSLRINYTSENILSMMSISDDFKDIDKEYKKNIRVKLYRVWQDAGGADIEDLVKQVINKFYAEGFKSHKGVVDALNYSCYADKWNGDVINYNGDVFRCTARDFTSTPRDGYLNENGDIVWENDSQNKRKVAKLKNDICLKCRILPLCGGGCSQVALEKGNIDYCILRYSEEQKDREILDRLMYYYRYTENFLFK